MSKGVSPIIASVFVILITVTAISIVLSVGGPYMKSLTQSATVGEAESNMVMLDNTVRQTAAEGVGVFKKVRMTSTEGIYRVDPAAETITYNLTLESDYIPEGGVTHGNVNKDVNDGELQLSVQYTEIDLNGSVRIGAGTYNLCFEKVDDSPSIVIQATVC